MNILRYLKPKATVFYLESDSTVRQGLEKLRTHSYTALPVIDREGRYVGTVTEGDFLRFLLQKNGVSLQECERYPLGDILRDDFNPPVSIHAPREEIVERLANQNFLPVVDDRGVFMGIVTRQDIIRGYLLSALPRQLIS